MDEKLSQKISSKNRNFFCWRILMLRALWAFSKRHARPLVISEYLWKHYAFKMGVVKIEKFQTFH